MQVCNGTVQSLYNTLCLGPIEVGQVISDLCYKGEILQRNYRKMTISCSWSFSYNSFVKFYGTKNLGAMI